MESINIGWKKQVPSKVDNSNKKATNSQKRFHRKNHHPKQQEPKQKAEPYVPPEILTQNLASGDHPYTPLPTINAIRRSIKNSAQFIQVYQDKKVCSVRAAIATFIIIIIIIAAAGVSVGVVFAAIKSQDSSSTTNNYDSFSTISSGLYTSSVSIGNQTGLPCSGYTEINDPTRNSSYIASANSCDNGPLFNTSGNGTWIRFVGSGGTKIPTSSPGLYHCGGFLSGWSNTTLPTVSGVITSGIVCFETYVHTCAFVLDISVVYCLNSYYVYFLPPIPFCNARYCTTQ